MGATLTSRAICAKAKKRTGAVMYEFRLTRRSVLSGVAASPVVPETAKADQIARRNISSFVIQAWRDHFDDLGVGAIV